uniref:COG4 transport protein, putative n=1 Tax=Theileria annulata TaxID=5874 RepID=A0A3B0MK36_THEAN
MNALELAYGRLSEIEGEILLDLNRLESNALEHLKKTRKQLENLSIKKIELELGDNFNKIESFGNKLKTVADESDCALNKIKKTVSVVETVTALYNSASKALDHFNNDTPDQAFSEIEKYIAAVESARTKGHWEEVVNVITKGYIGQVISSLRLVVIESLRTNVSNDHSKLLTRLALSLNAEKEAYDSYLSFVKVETERGTALTSLTAPYNNTSNEYEGYNGYGISEMNNLNRVILKSKNLLNRQGNSVLTELGTIYYIKIVREIHLYSSTEASKIFIDFIKTNLLTNHISTQITEAQLDKQNQMVETNGFEISEKADLTQLNNSDSLNSASEAIISELEKTLKDSNFVNMITSEVKYQKLLDNIAIMASLWIDFETSLRETTAPIYANLLVKQDEKEYSPDGLVFLSNATKMIQSILSAYVHLQHAFTLKTVVQAIQVSDTIYISENENTLTSTLVDDVFFILQKSQHRSIGTGDIQTACATFNQVSSIISNELKNALTHNLVQSQPIYEKWTQKLENLMNGSLYNMLDEYFKRTRGGFPELIGEFTLNCHFKTGSKYSFVHSLNNIEECLGLLAKFKEEMSECFSKEFLKQKEKNLLVENAIQELDSVETELEQILETCCNYALNMFKDHLNDPLIKFSMAEESFSDIVVSVLDIVLSHIKSSYSPNVGLKCMNNLLEKLCKYLENMVLEKKFTIYGAVYFDGAVRSLVHSCSKHNQELRKQFSTLLQISDVLNVNNADDLILLKGIFYVISHFIEFEYKFDIYKYSSLRTDLTL